MGVIEPDTKVLLFLGRLHPKKGLHELIDAWEDWSRQSSASDEWALGIVGWDDGGHEDALRRRAEKSNAGDSIHFLGPQFGADKHAAFAHADAFILPSFSEGFPMAVLEAWSHRLPVLKTDACNIPEGFESGAAIEVTTDTGSIAAGIEEVTRADADERAAIGGRGRKLVEDRFTWPRVARQMYDVYQWILGDGDRPDSVVMN
jgi:poly(glycerol-phosphate) alpha-glucosyltransferase